jgi:tetratricopeptide (TPR) repeat protein
VLSLVLVLLAQPLPPNHPPPGGTAPPNADDLIKKLDSTAGLKERDKPFEIAASLGRLYFGQGRYADAQTFYKQALSQAEEARVLFAAQRKLAAGKPLPAPATVGCEISADATLAKLMDKAKAQVTAKNAAGATVCLKAALAPLMEVDVMYANTQFLLGDAVGAIATFSRALDTFETNTDARYGRAAATLDAQGDDLAALARAKADFEKFLAEVPTSPRAANAKRLLTRTEAALSAGGLSKATITAQQVAAVSPQQVEQPRRPGMPPQLTPEMIEAFQNAPRTPEMAENFKKLVSDAEEHLARGRFQDALDAYKQVMPYQPENARLRAGMAWTMIKLNRQPMADNVWRVASQTPEAIVELGDALKAKGDVEGAKAVWTRLRDTVPGANLQGRL